MTADDLTWTKAKNAIVLAVAGVSISMLLAVLRGQQQCNDMIAELRKDLAVLSVETARDRLETREIKDRLARLEARR